MLQFQTLGVVSNRKMNIFDTLYSFLKKIEKNKKKNDGKTGIFTLNQFSTKLIFYMVVTQKLTTVNTQKFHQMFFVGKNILGDQKKIENLIQVKFFTKSVKNAKICKIENTTLSFPYVFLQVSIEKTRSIILRKILSAVDKIFLAPSKYLKILYKVPHMLLKHKPPFSPITGNYILG
ncbi:hypothetical protein AGLY_008763 [Aphis glycines]|uniref:Uncharacterized protein n=1 Tax=Aphis glycines TaxID=307491 RepID=A0A6G0TLR0_APHGL|nr:hypothetical protein AGLY_008763 [Aphis glycines]